MNGEVTDAALNWWASIRPAAYTLEDHLKNPEVNTTTRTLTKKVKGIEN